MSDDAGADSLAREPAHMAGVLDVVRGEPSAPNTERSGVLTAMANRIVDATYLNCQGNLGEVAVVLSYALASVLRSWPQEAGREMLATAGRLLHRTLWAACSDAASTSNLDQS